MQGFDIICENIIVLGLAMLVGFAAVKTGYISEEVKNAMSKIVVKITLPILVMMSLTSLEMDSEKIRNSIFVFVVSIITVGILYGIGMLFSWLFKMDRPRSVIYECMTAFGNVVFLGYPLLEALYGPEGLLYAAIYGFANDCFVWTIGVYKLAAIKNKGAGIKDNLKNLINPATVAFAVSLIMMSLGLKFTGIPERVLSGIGGLTTYLSMLFIGGTLALVDFKHIYKHLSLLLIPAVKMLIVPVLLALILAVVPGDNIAKCVIVIQAAMPCQTILTVLTTEYDGDTVFAAEGVFVTTIASLATIPLVYWIMSGIIV